VVATGCLASLDGSSVLETGADLIIGNDAKDHLPRILKDEGVLPPPAAAAEEPRDALLRSRTRAFLKIQDGCDNRCSFCVVTLARGAGRSRPVEEVLTDVRHLLALGYREIVLSGVHLGSFGHDRGDRRGLEHLVRRLLSDTAIERLRLSSLEPWDLEEEFFELFENPRLLPHLHLPLQSGCDATLGRMARRSDRAGFALLVRAARGAAPDISITTDVMVGFPGETEDEFEESIDFVESLSFSRLHVFRYSRRPGTAAASMPHQVPGPLAAERCRRMIELGGRLQHRFNSRFVGATLPVLWEARRAEGDRLRWSGLTDHYVRVTTTTGTAADLDNRIAPVRVLDSEADGLVGTLTEASESRSQPTVG
jgi:threonylcarbamoyladenosine tRNA methylthiotransferase MtaB